MQAHVTKVGIDDNRQTLKECVAFEFPPFPLQQKRDEFVVETFLDEVRSFYLEMWQKSQDEAMNKVPEIIAAVKDVTDADSVQGLIKLMKATP